jgi:uncharacterized OsmC-like protein
MYSMIVDDSPLIKVQAGKHEVMYSVNGSFMNPLEALYAALAGCASVFAKKACKGLGISAEGIEISCKPFAGTGGPLTLSKYKTEVRFPAHFTAEQKAEIMDSISHCAVKEIVKEGASVEFIANEV